MEDSKNYVDDITAWLIGNQYGSIRGTTAPKNETLTSFATGRIGALLRRADVSTLPEGITTVDARGNPILLLCLDTDTAFAKRIDKTSYAILGKGLLRNIFHLLAGLWSHPHFMPWIGDISRLTIIDRNNPFPPGMEPLFWRTFAASSSENMDERDATPCRHIAERAVLSQLEIRLSDRLSRLCPIRRRLFETSYAAAIDFLWLHELGHILCGHLNWRGANALSAESDIGPTATVHRPDTDGEIFNPVSYGMEIEADTWASNHLSERRGKEHMQARIARAIGLASIFMFFQAQRNSENTIMRSYSHPPVWYRTARCVFGNVSKKTTDEINHAFRSAGELHPIYGEWLEPLTRGTWESAGRNLEDHLRKTLAPLFRALKAHRQAVRIN